MQSGTLRGEALHPEGSEMDLVVVIIAVAFFVISGVLVGLLDRF